MNDIPGLSARCNSIVQHILEQHPAAAPFVLFGSRAKGNYREGSDIDICAKGQCTPCDLAALRTAFDDSALPYFVDVISYNNITSPSLRKDIESWGKEL